MKEALHIPIELRVHLTPGQPAFDQFNWVSGGPDPEPKSARRPEDAGKFGSNNGILVVYDEVGDPFVVPFRELQRHGISPADTAHKLRAAGFEASYVYVPHSNDGGSFVVKLFPDALKRSKAEA